MKVYIITKEPFPNGMAATNRIQCYAKAIISQGIECKVLIYTRTEVYGKKPKNIEGHGIIDGIPFQYIGGTSLRDPNILIRQFNDYTDKYKINKFLKTNLQEGDIVFGYNSCNAYFLNSIIQTTHKKKSLFVRDLCELPYGTSTETKSTIKKRKFTLNKHIPLCDGIIAISDSLVNLAKQYTSQMRVIKIPIMVDFEQYCIEDKSECIYPPYIFHSGTLYEQKDGVLGMIEAFGKAINKIDQPIKFILTGNLEASPHSEKIRELITTYHLKDRLIFTGYLSSTELKSYLSQASLVIINKYRTQQNEYCFSTKLSEYLAASKPTIITNVGEAMNWLVDNKNAYIVEPERSDLLAMKIVEAFSDSFKRRNIARNGKELCKTNFDYKVYGPKIISFLNTIKSL